MIDNNTQINQTNECSSICNPFHSFSSEKNGLPSPPNFYQYYLLPIINTNKPVIEKTNPQGSLFSRTDKE